MCEHTKNSLIHKNFFYGKILTCGFGSIQVLAQLKKNGKKNLHRNRQDKIIESEISHCVLNVVVIDESLEQLQVIYTLLLKNPSICINATTSNDKREENFKKSLFEKRDSLKKEEVTILPTLEIQLKSKNYYRMGKVLVAMYVCVVFGARIF